VATSHRLKRALDSRALRVVPSSQAGWRPETLLVGGKPLQTRIRRHGSRGDPRPCGRHSTLRGLTATAGFLGRFQADSRAGSARDEEAGGRMSNTYADLQDFYGSDGTRTRDLRRDRPVFGAAGLSGDRRGFRRELVFRHCRCGDWRARSRASGDLVRDERGMDRCREQQHSRMWPASRRCVLWPARRYDLPR
jgi:hypothetical protein